MLALVAGSTHAAGQYEMRFPAPGPAAPAKTTESSTPEVAPGSISPVTLALAASSLPKARIGQPYSFDFKPLLTIGGEPLPDISQIIWAEIGALPEGLSLGESGLLTGTPTGEAKTHNVGVMAEYDATYGDRNYALVIRPDVLFDNYRLDDFRSAGFAWLAGTYFTYRNSQAALLNETQFQALSSTDGQSWTPLFTSSLGAEIVERSAVPSNDSGIRAVGNRIYALRQHAGAKTSVMAFSWNGTSLTHSTMTGLYAPGSSYSYTSYERTFPAYQAGLGYVLQTQAHSSTTGSATVFIKTPRGYPTALAGGGNAAVNSRRLWGAQIAVAVRALNKLAVAV